MEETCRYIRVQCTAKIKLINNIIHEIIAYINANPEQYYVIE